MPESGLFSFGPFLFDPRTGELTRDGVPVRITPRTADVLRCLIERRGTLTSKEDLLREVWNDTHVNESSITFHMSLLRKALGDDPEELRYIETLPKRGYRFLEPVTILARAATNATSHGSGRTNPVDRDPSTAVLTAPQTEIATAALAEEVSDYGPSAPASGWMRHRRVGWSVGIGLALLVAVMAIAVRFSDPLLPRVVGLTRLTTDGLLKARLLPFDDSRLAVTMGSRQRLFRLDTGRFEEMPGFAGFELHDVSPRRREAIGVLPRDPGAEDGLWIIPLDGRASERLGMVRINDYAAWSNDGSRIAHAFDKGLFVVTRDTVQVNEIARVAGLPECLQWSPDDRFLRMKVRAYSGRTVTTTLWDVDVSNGNLVKALDATGLIQPGCGRWVPERSEYVVLAGAPGQEQIWLARETANVFRGVRHDTVQLTRESGKFVFPVPSSDGRKTFAIRYFIPELVQYDSASGAFAPFLNGIDARAVEFSRDGRWLTYVDGLENLWRAKSDGSGGQQLTSAPFAVSGAAWSPDGKLLAIRGGPAGARRKVHIMRSDGGRPEPLMPDDVEQGMPSWSHDGRRLTFGDVPETWGAPTGSERIHIFDFTTGTLSDIPGSNRLWSSRWSPDGRRILALTADTQELHVLEVATGEWRRVGVGRANNPAWSPDSRFIYLDPEGPKQSVRRVSVQDGREDVIVDLEEFAVPWAGIAPDGTVLITRVLTDIYAIELTR